MPAGVLHVRDPYCSERCRVGGMQVVCWTCKKPATMVGDWHHCETCFSPPPNATRKHELDQGGKSLMMANKLFRFGGVPKEEGDAKRRKRA